MRLWLVMLVCVAGCSGDDSAGMDSGTVRDGGTDDVATGMDSGLDAAVMDVGADAMIGEPRCRFFLEGEEVVHESQTSWQVDGERGVLTCNEAADGFNITLSVDDMGLGEQLYSCRTVDFGNQISMTYRSMGTVWAASGDQPEDPCAILISHYSAAGVRGTFSGTLLRVSGEGSPERLSVTDGVFELPTSSL